MWFIGVEVEQETRAPPPKKNPTRVRDFLTASRGFKISAIDQSTHSCTKI